MSRLLDGSSLSLPEFFSTSTETLGTAELMVDLKTISCIEFIYVLTWEQYSTTSISHMITPYLKSTTSCLTLSLR